jgi:hypothetical protein
MIIESVKKNLQLPWGQCSAYFKHKSNISPNWGKEICDSELKNVQEILVK